MTSVEPAIALSVTAVFFWLLGRLSMGGRIRDLDDERRALLSAGAELAKEVMSLRNEKRDIPTP